MDSANLLGLLIGFVVITLFPFVFFVLLIIDIIIPGLNGPLGFTIRFLLPAMLGFPIGVAQGLFLLRRLRAAFGWALAMAFGMAVALLVSLLLQTALVGPATLPGLLSEDSAPNIEGVFLSAGAVVGGLLAGGGQAILCRFTVRKAVA